MFLPHSRHTFFPLLLVGIFFSAAVAQESPKVTPVEVARRKAIDQYKQRQAIQGELKSMQAEVRNINKSITAMASSQADLQKQLAEIQKKLKDQAAASTASGKKFAVATKTEKNALTALQAAQKKLATAKAASAVAKKDADAKLSALQTTKETIAGIQKKTTDLLANSMKMAATMKRAVIKINEKNTELKSSVSVENKNWEEVAKQHQQAGTWISFAKEIAPLLQKRCLACHNEGKPRGRLKMDNYDVLMHGGESGELVDLADPELSTLVTMIEDGSMPKDDDPLSKEQISTIKKWISMGARLDSGVSKTSPLIEMMPRPKYQTPPEEYPAPIPVNAVALHSDGKRAATSGYHELLIWSTETGELIRRIPGVAERIYALEFMGNSNLIAVAAGTPGEVGEVNIIDISTGSLIKSLHISAAIVTGLDFSTAESHLAICGAGGAIHLFETGSWNKILTIHDHGDWVNDVAWSPDGTKIASASRDKSSKVFDVKTGNNLMTFNGHKNVVTVVTFLPGGEEIVTGGEDRRLRIWKLADASEVRNVAGFAGPITALKLLEDGRLLSASTDRKLRLHAAADSKVEKTWTGPTSELLSLDGNNSHSIAVSGSLGGEIHMWSLTEQKPIRTWLAKPVIVPVSKSSEPKTSGESK